MLFWGKIMATKIFLECKTEGFLTQQQTSQNALAIVCNTQAIVSRLGNTKPTRTEMLLFGVIINTFQRGGKDAWGRKWVPFSSGTPASRDSDRLRFKLSLEQCVCSVSNPSRTASERIFLTVSVQQPNHH